MKNKKFLTGAIALMMAFTSASMVACGGTQVGEQVNTDKAQLYVGYYEGGWGGDWMKYLKTEFEAQYPDVQIVLTPKKYEYDSELLMSSIKDGTNDIYFTTIYSHDYVKGESAENLLLDVTDVVTKPLKDVLSREVTLKNGTKLTAKDTSAFASETKSIEGKMDAEMQTYYKSSSKNGDKYFGIPHSGSTVSLNYDVDLFEEKSLFISSYDADSKEYTWTNGKAGSPAKWVGQDGKANTYDDGLPVTYEDFKALCREIVDAGCIPLTYSAGLSAYRERYLGSVLAQYVGADEFSLIYSQNGHSDELDMDITAENAYELQKSEGKKAMLQIAYDFNHNGWLSVNNGAFNEAQDDFINSKYDAQTIDGVKRMAMILEGSWWENEAKATLEANKTTHPEDSNRRFGIMTVPFFKGTAGIADQTSTEKTAVVGSADVGIYIRKNAEQAELAKQFMAFAITDKNLKETTKICGEVKPYDYTLSDSDLASMSYYKQATWDNLKGEGVVRTRQVGPSTLMKNNRAYFTYEFICEAGKDWTDPFRLFGEYADKTVEQYYEAMKAYHNASQWAKLTK